MFTYKVDEEVSLKLVTMQDAPRIFELTDGSRAYLKQWLPWLDTTTTVKDTEGYLQFSLQNFAANKGLNTVILYKGEFVGVAGFNEINWSKRTAHIGYWLGESYQGHGIMTRVAKALTAYAFSELKLNKVEIHAAEGNHKSRSIPERLGYVKEGCIRSAEWLYDHYVDHAVYGMLASEWKNDSVSNLHEKVGEK